MGINSRQVGAVFGEGLINEVRDPLKDGSKVIHPGVEDKRSFVLEAEFACTLDDDPSSG